MSSLLSACSICHGSSPSRQFSPSTALSLVLEEELDEELLDEELLLDEDDELDDDEELDDEEELDDDDEVELLSSVSSEVVLDDEELSSSACC